MCPARVECPDGHKFILPADGVLDERVGPDFNHIPPEDKQSFEWDTAFGTDIGFSIYCEGREPSSVNVTPSTIVYEHDQKGYVLRFVKGNVWVLPGGTRVVPIDSSGGKLKEKHTCQELCEHLFETWSGMLEHANGQITQTNIDGMPQMIRLANETAIRQRGLEPNIDPKFRNVVLKRHGLQVIINPAVYYTALEGSIPSALIQKWK